MMNRVLLHSSLIALAACPAAFARAPTPDAAAPAPPPASITPPVSPGPMPAQSAPAQATSPQATAAPPAAGDAAADDADDAAASAAPYAGIGLDLAGRDTTVAPGADFERYMNGHWGATHTIPADRAYAGPVEDIYVRSQDDLRRVIASAPPGSQYGTLYAAFLDEAKVESVGIAPLRTDLDAIAAIADKRAFARAMGATKGGFGLALVDVEVDPDTADATMNGLWLGQDGIGLPDRDYYLLPAFGHQRDAYVAYMARTFQALGHADPAGAAARVMAFETAIAHASWASADRRDLDKINNPMSSAALAAFAPGLDWAAFLAGAGVAAPQARIIVNEKSAVHDLAAIYAATPLDTLKLWESFHIADDAAPYLPKAWVDSRFAYTRTLSGVSELRPRWKRAASLVDDALGEQVGQAYVARYFPPASKARMETLVANLKAAMADRIAANAWMSAPTRQAALDKLARMEVMVGYPDRFRDYSGLTITRDDLYGDVKRADAFNWAYELADLGKPVDRKKWAMNPQEVNAYNGGLENKIVFPAGFLQTPVFNPDADDAVNYGAIGAVIGHEISHGFDDQGRKIDATGAVRNWWTPADAARFDAQAKVFGAQYARFEAAPGLHINPALTMGENIADFAGLQVALDAYHKSLHGAPAPVIAGFTGDQRFFMAFAQAWREHAREDAVRRQVTSDPHSPSRFRVLGPLPNIDAWYAAFGVKPGDAMYIPPEQRARIW